MAKPNEAGASPDEKRSIDKNAAKASNVVKRDTSKEEEKHPSSPAEEALDDRDKAYRPDENVDNEKSPEGQVEPGHNSSIEQTPISGKQLRDKPFQKDNIREEAEDSESPRRNG
jgi:hypothetical protein